MPSGIVSVRTILKRALREWRHGDADILGTDRKSNVRVTIRGVTENVSAVPEPAAPALNCGASGTARVSSPARHLVEP